MFLCQSLCKSDNPNPSPNNIDQQIEKFDKYDDSEIKQSKIDIKSIESNQNLETIDPNDYPIDINKKDPRLSVVNKSKPTRLIEVQTQEPLSDEIKTLIEMCAGDNDLEEFRNAIKEDIMEMEDIQVGDVQDQIAVALEAMDILNSKLQSEKQGIILLMGQFEGLLLDSPHFANYIKCLDDYIELKYFPTEIKNIFKIKHINPTGREQDDENLIKIIKEWYYSTEKQFIYTNSDIIINISDLIKGVSRYRSILEIIAKLKYPDYVSISDLALKQACLKCIDTLKYYLKSQINYQSNDEIKEKKVNRRTSNRCSYINEEDLPYIKKFMNNSGILFKQPRKNSNRIKGFEEINQ